MSPRVEEWRETRNPWDAPPWNSPTKPRIPKATLADSGAPFPSRPQVDLRWRSYVPRRKVEEPGAAATASGRGGFRHWLFSEGLEYEIYGRPWYPPKKTNPSNILPWTPLLVLTQLKCSSPQTHQNKHRNTEEGKDQNIA